MNPIEEKMEALTKLAEECKEHSDPHVNMIGATLFTVSALICEGQLEQLFESCVKISRARLDELQMGKRG